MTFWERFGYAIGKGITAAILEDLRKPRTAEDERVTNEDQEKFSRLGDYLDAHIASLQAPPHGNNQPGDTAPTGGPGNGDDLG